ncbi:Hypothetical predicted protein, partial [Marmota monax]
CAFKKEENTRNDSLFFEPNRDQLNEITNGDNKEIKKKPETSVRKFDTELNITADEFNQNLNLD